MLPIVGNKIGKQLWLQRQQSHSRVRENYLNAGYGLKSWLLTTDHKRIALLYLVSITFMFFIGGFFASHDPPGTADAGRRSGDIGHL